MTKIRLVLMTLSSLLGGNILQQDDADFLHFQSCDQRLEFNYPAEFALQENADSYSHERPDIEYVVYTNGISLQYHPSGDRSQQLRPPIHLDISIDRALSLYDDTPNEWMESRLVTRNMTQREEIELQGYSGIMGTSWTDDGFMVVLDMEDDYMLNFVAFVDDEVSPDTLMNAIDIIAGSLQFDKENAVPDGQGFFFTDNCDLSLFYPVEWADDVHRRRYVFFDTGDTYADYVSRRPIREGNVLVEVMTHEQILSYFDLMEDEASAEDVLHSFMEVRDLMPYEVPQVATDDAKHEMLTAHYAGGLVTVLDINSELTIIALFTGGDVEDYAEEYRSMIDSIRLNGRGEDSVSESAGERQ